MAVYYFYDTFMKLDLEQVEHIAFLARLELTTEEKEKFAKELTMILDYVDQLSEVDTEGFEPIAQITGLVNVIRRDMQQKCAARDNLLAVAPVVEDELIKVQSVF